MPWISSQGGGGGGGGTVNSVTAADTSIVIAGPGTDPTVRTNTLDVIAADHPPAADWSNNSHKITGLANGAAASDAAAFGQIPTALPPNGAASGDLAGSYPSPTVAAIHETGGPTKLTVGAVPDGDILRRSGATLIGVAQQIGCRVFNSTDQTCGSNSFLTLAFDSERFDNGSMHSTVSNTSRITFPAAGVYFVGAVIRWNAGPTAPLELGITLNGTTNIGYQKTNASSSGGSIMATSCVWLAAANDYVELVVFNNDAASATVTSTADISPEFYAALLYAS